MEDPKERLTARISTEELERRWKAARGVMKERKIDYLLLRNDEEFMGGYVRWFTDLPARHSYPFTVIFPSGGDEPHLGRSFPSGRACSAALAVRGVKRRLSAPYFPSAHYTYTYDAELAVSVLKRTRRQPSPGWSLLYSMNFYGYLVDHLPGRTLWT